MEPEVSLPCSQGLATHSVTHSILIFNT